MEKTIVHNTMKYPLVWIDCEMTGFELSIDELIEAAVIVMR